MQRCRGEAGRGGRGERRRNAGKETTVSDGRKLCSQGNRNLNLAPWGCTVFSAPSILRGNRYLARPPVLCAGGSPS